jgi:hypothetical protein
MLNTWVRGQQICRHANSVGLVNYNPGSKQGPGGAPRYGCVKGCQQACVLVSMYACKQTEDAARSPPALWSTRFSGWSSQVCLNESKQAYMLVSMHVCKQTNKQADSPPLSIKNPSPAGESVVLARGFTRHVESVAAGWGTRLMLNTWVRGQQKGLYASMQACKQTSLCQPRLSR